ncbi:MAG: peptide chain release factor N(5)-glutamine methyltransferase [Alphaproteobacteria bacterium]|nr:peptide chain release factor N(5)-glutamine methyltransferase [Alphaproteobacteria bacterium]
MARALGAAARTLGNAGVEDPRRDAQVLIGHALGVDRAVVVGHPERAMSDHEVRAFEALVAGRSRRIPVAVLVGSREFWSLSFRVTADTLVPRPDSETVVSAVLDRVDRRLVRRVLDLGTGTGCLLLALLRELPEAFGVGVDRSPAAAAVAALNATNLGLAGRARFVVGDWHSGLRGPFDVVVANPPYIATVAIADLVPDVARHEPRIALDGGPDGLGAYRAILPGLGRLLAPSGLAVLEVGQGQASAVAALAGADLSLVGGDRDLAGMQRCIVLKPVESLKKGLGKVAEVH